MIFSTILCQSCLADPRDNVQSHFDQGQAFLVFDRQGYLYFNETPWLDLSDGLSFLQNRDDELLIFWLGPPSVIFDDAGEISNMVSQAIMYHDRPEDMGGPKWGVSGYGATWYDSGYYDTVLVDFDDRSVTRFQDHGEMIQPQLDWRWSDASDDTGFVASSRFEWTFDNTNDVVSTFENDHLMMDATPDTFDVAYKRIYDTNHGLTKEMQSKSKNGKGDKKKKMKTKNPKRRVHERGATIVKGANNNNNNGSNGY